METAPLYLASPRPVTGRIMHLDYAGLHNNLVLVRQITSHKADAYWSPKGADAWSGTGLRTTKH